MALWNKILFPVSNIWDNSLVSPDPNKAKDPTSFTSGGGIYQPGSTIAYEGVDKSQNSQTQFMRSMQNLLANQGQSEFGIGQQIAGEGTDALRQSLDYFQRLLGSNRSELEAATASETDPIAQQFDQIRRMFSETGPRGGGRTSTLAQMPFQQTAQISSLINRARANAASGVSDAGKAIAGIGLNRAGMGASLLSEADKAVLMARGQDTKMDTDNRNMLASGLTNIAAEPISKALTKLLI